MSDRDENLKGFSLVLKLISLLIKILIPILWMVRIASSTGTVVIPLNEVRGIYGVSCNGDPVMWNIKITEINGSSAKAVIFMGSQSQDQSLSAKSEISLETCSGEKVSLLAVKKVDSANQDVEFYLFKNIEVGKQH